MRARHLLLLILLSAIGCGGMGSAEAERARKSEQQTQMMADRAQQAEAVAEREIEIALREIERLKSENEALRRAVARFEEGQASKRKEPQAADTSATTGSLIGQVIFDGEVPELPPLVSKGDNIRDANVCAAADIPDERLIVGPDGGLANVVIFLPQSPAGYTPPAPPKSPLVFDRIACRFIPHVLVVRTGQKMVVRNSDPIAHNVHTNPRLNKPHNQTMNAMSVAENPIEYVRPETLPVRVMSDFHVWMQAWHLPLDHPFSTVTDTKGRFEIKGLPAGEHEFRVWHEMANLLESRLSVTIEADQQAELELKYAAKRFE